MAGAARVLPAAAERGGFPDGSKLAVEVDSGHNGQPGLLEIRVYTLAAGAFRTWSTHGSDDPVDTGGFTGSGVDGSQTISWAADSTTLAFDWGNQTRIGVRLLDTAASGGNLIADSRLAVIEASFTSQGGGRPGHPSMSKDHISQCVTDGIISSDGAAIVCGYTTNIDGRETTTGFIRYSTTTGKPTAVLGVYQFQGQALGDISLYWVNSTGKILVGGPDAQRNPRRARHRPAPDRSRTRVASGPHSAWPAHS